MPRQSGYRVTIRGFLPADRKSIEDTAKAIKMIQGACPQEGKVSPEHQAQLLDALVGVEIEATSTSREIPAAGAPDPEPFA